MHTRDFLKLTGTSLVAHRMRSALTALGISVGIAAVVLLTSIGEGLQQFVVAQFTQFGTTIVAVNPGKATTAGTSMGIFGSERPLTIEDARALEQLSFARAVVPFVQGNAEVESERLRASPHHDLRCRAGDARSLSDARERRSFPSRG